jgi:hypothetical protein
VIDEAAMASTRGLAPLLDTAHTAGAKVVMVGDPHQLDAIDAGGLLTGLANRLQPVTLTENRRQQQSWERDALTELRAGHVAPALDAYHRHDRVVVCETAIDVRNQMAADWYAATLTGHQVIMLAERHHDVDDLNERARRHLTNAGALTGPALDANGHTFQTGDRVLCLRNDRRLGLRNGTLATVIAVTAVDPDAGALTIRTGDAIAIVPRRYLDAGHLTHGYALTVHKSQGTTVDRCLVLASDTLDGQMGYTALSRGRIDNRIYLIAQPETDPEQHHPGRQSPDPNAELAEALKTDHRQHLAIDHGFDQAAICQHLNGLYRQRAQLTWVRHAIPPDRATDIRALERERDEQMRTLDRAVGVRDRVRAARPKLRRHREHAAEDLAAERAHEQSACALERIDAALRDACDAQSEHEGYRWRHADDLDRLTMIERTIGHRLDQLADAETNDPSYYLRDLGEPPRAGWARETWRQAARNVAAYRAENDVTNPYSTFGDMPTEPVALANWHRAVSKFAIDCDAVDTCRRSASRGQERDDGVEIGL